VLSSLMVIVHIATYMFETVKLICGAKERIFKKACTEDGKKTNTWYSAEKHVPAVSQRIGRNKENADICCSGIQYTKRARNVPRIYSDKRVFIPPHSRLCVAPPLSDQRHSIT
jgi:hypothetical protein